MTGTEKSPRRRDVLRATAGASLLGITGLTASSETAQGRTTQETETETETGTGTPRVDSPEKFTAEVLAPHATFVDDVAVEFQINYADGAEDGTTTPERTPAPDDADDVATLRDASTVVFAKLTWRPGGTTGWHTHPGPVIVTVTEGELEIVTAEDCTTRIYTAGEAFVDPGTHVEVANNPSETERTVVYATFLGVPDGGSPTKWAEPQDC